MEDSTSGYPLKDHFETALWKKIEDAKRKRGREEIIVDYDLLNGRLDVLKDDYFEGDTDMLVTNKAQEGMKVCTELSKDLEKSTAQETDLLGGLEELIEDLLFRLETINHYQADDEEQDDEDFCEESAYAEITAVLKDRAAVKSKVQHNIISCNAKLSNIKNEISELVNSNPRTRRISKQFKTLNFAATMAIASGSAGGNRENRRSIIAKTPEEPEQFNPNTFDASTTAKYILKFIHDQELPPDEVNPVIAKVNIMQKFLDHSKKELKAANQRATDDQIKCNNLQSRIPKLEESRVKLSQQIEVLQDKIRDRDTTIAKLNMKISSMENMANKPTTTPTTETKESKETTKQAVVPKSTLRDILQSSDKEVEDKLKQLASSNEAIRVVLVRKNKQMRQLEGTIIQLKAETISQKTKIDELREAIVSGTADADAICQEREEEGKVEPTGPEEIPHPSPVISDTIKLFQSTIESIDLDSDDMDSTAPADSIQRVFIDGATNTEIEFEDVYTQTVENDDEDDDNELTSHDLGSIRLRRKKKGLGVRKVSVALAAEDGIRKAARRASIMDPAQRRGSMAQKDVFGIGAGKHSLTKTDLATLQEFQRTHNLNEKTIKQVEDISVLQKYIASMREQSEKGMEKVREFIAKEKQRNEATIRRLINEHEKFLSNHKKEFNKVFYSIQRFKEIMCEILNGKDITQIVPQTTFKSELSPIQLRIQSTETLSSLEFDVFQALKEKDMKIRDLSGRKRLDDKDLDRRIKEREKAVFSILDVMNERLKKEKELITKKEKWVNEKIKVELEYEKAQANEVQSIEKVLVKFWKEHPELVAPLAMTPSETQPRAPSTSPRALQSPDEVEQITRPQRKERSPSPGEIQYEMSEQSLIPRLYVRVSDQRNNMVTFDKAHRAGLISNLAHKLISNIIDRWLELIEQKICRLFKAYIKYRRFSDLQTEVMKEDSDEGNFSPDMGRAMILHRRISNAMDLQHKRLHVELGKLAAHCGALLEEEEHFFNTIPDNKLLKSVVRPVFHQISGNVMFRKLLEVAQEKRTVQVSVPHVLKEESSASTIPLEDIPVLKRVANNRQTGTWHVDYKEDTQAKPLLVPKMLQLDTNKMCPIRLSHKQPTQHQPNNHGTPRKVTLSGLPPIPRSERISYIPTISSVWTSIGSNKKHS